jgi:flavin-dependent dehydrogenase
MENLTPSSGILDLAIIGGGPAGAAAALEARRQGLSVAIWERDRFPRDKVCGEFISFEAHPFLQNEIPGTVARGAEIRSAQFVTDHGASRTFRLPRPALGLSRRVLDVALWKAAEAAGVDVHEGEAVRRVQNPVCGPRPGGVWGIESDRGSGRRSRALIVACGRWWAIEGLSSPAGRREPLGRGDWIGAKAHLAGISPRDRVEMYFFRGGYCGLAPVEDGAFNVCCLVAREQVRQSRPKALEDFAAWVAQASHLHALETRLRGAVQVSPVVTTAPVHLARRRAVQGGVLMVGDASGFLDPFTGEGISMALHSGRLAARAVACALSEGFLGQSAAEIYDQSLSQAVRRSYRIAAMARGLIQGPAWLRGLVTAPLPWVGKHLVRETRWRGNPCVEPG